MTAGALGVVVVVVATAEVRVDIPPESAMSLHLDVADAPAVPELSAFLRERVVEAWGEASIVEEAARFRVVLRWPAERSINVQVSEGGGVLAERILVVTAADAAKLTVWLFVRATVERALVAHTPEPVVSAAEAEEPAESPTVTEPTAVAPPTVVPPAPRGPLQVNALFSMSFGTPRMLAAGPALGVWWRPWSPLRLGADLGYRVAPRVVGLVVHHVPLRLYAGWQAHDRVTLGGSATVDVKVASSGAKTRTSAGVEAGGFLQLYVPFERPGAGFILRGGLGGRLVRQRYRLDTGDVTERPWDASVGVGVEWP